MLKFNNLWRFDSPGKIADGVYSDFLEISLKISRGDQRLIEHFKRYFAAAIGSTTSWSSSASWAESDLMGYMSNASENAPVFIEAFYDACEDLRELHPDSPIPDVSYLNKVLFKHNAKYEINPPNLISIDSDHKLSLPAELPVSLDQKAKEIIQTSFSESQKLLSEGRFKQAVQEVLWLLETVSTVFQGVTNAENRVIEGKYFNKIIGDLRRKNNGRALEQIIGWIMNLHGYLSAPAGGGIRHGLDLKEGVATSPGEARLYCNLITSYINFLLSEYERFNTNAGEQENQDV